MAISSPATPATGYNAAFFEGLQDLGIPVSVQTFLWQQILPFIKPKLGKLHETSCMVRIISYFFYLLLQNSQNFMIKILDIIKFNVHNIILIVSFDLGIFFSIFVYVF